MPECVHICMNIKSKQPYRTPNIVFVHVIIVFRGVYLRFDEEHRLSNTRKLYKNHWICVPTKRPVVNAFVFARYSVDQCVTMHVWSTDEPFAISAGNLMRPHQISSHTRAHCAIGRECLSKSKNDCFFFRFRGGATCEMRTIRLKRRCVCVCA